MQLATKELLEIQEIMILLIEDSPGDAAAITKALIYGETLYSFKTHRERSLGEALAYIGDHKVDVVLLDLGLPDAMDLIALKEVHQQFPDLPIVIISGHSDINMVHEALRNGAQEFLIKGECSGVVIRQSVYQAIARKKIELSYKRGDKL